MRQILLISFSVIFVLTTVGCSRKPSRVLAPTIDATAAGQKAIELYDTNKDGVISGDELDACPALKVGLKHLDKDGSGGISAQEITDRILMWQEIRVGLTGVPVRVTLGGQKIKSGEVTFYPVEFLKESLKQGKGTITDGTGNVSSEGNVDNISGMAYGFYNVTVHGDGIPPKYSDSNKMLLGTEIYDQEPDYQMEGCHVFDLSKK